MLCIPTIQTIKMDMLALRTAAEFSLRQQSPKTAVLDTIFLTDRIKT